MAELERSHLMLLAGFILLGWVLVRRTISRRRRYDRESQGSDRALSKLRDSKRSAAPLCDAPVETQRWQVALFDLQRELKADLDTRIAVVQSLVREADRRIEQLSELQSTSSRPATKDPATDRGPVGEEGGRCGEAAAGEAAAGEAAAGEAAAGEAAADGGELASRHHEFRQIAELAASGHTAAEIAEQLGQPVDHIESALATWKSF